MADVKFAFYSPDSKEIVIDKIKSFELLRETGAPCDGLRLWLTAYEAMGEIKRVTVTIDGVRVFNGYCDTQRETVSENGFVCFIYARSSACILTGIEAKPDSFASASARAIYEKYIAQYGFSYEIPEINYAGRYTVAKGTSLYGALDGFVFGVTGKHIYINAFDEIKLLESERVRVLDSDIISEKRLINRGDLLLGIDYKLTGDENYAHHRVSELMKRTGVTSKVMKNLSSLTPLQREKMLFSAMVKANEEYVCYELDVCGLFVAELCDKIRYKSVAFGNTGTLSLKETAYIFDSKGFHTRLKLVEDRNLEEVSYVDE